MAEAIQDQAAIDEVCTFFEEQIAALVPLSESGKTFRLLGDEAGLLSDQPKNAKFFRQFDIRSHMDGESEESYMPLGRRGMISIFIGYLGSMKTRRLAKIVRQDEELIARYLIQANVGEADIRPYNWDFVPPAQIEDLDQGAATILVLTYEVSYTCDEVT